MGEIERLPIEAWRKQFGLNCFVETGSWVGNGIRAALRAGFPRVISVEISSAQAAVAADRVQQAHPREAHRWEIVVGDSSRVIPELLSEGTLAEPQATRVMWWLDAHFPERYKGGEGERLPLLAEVRALATQRPGFERDVVVIDDWRIYEEISNASGRLPDFLRVDGQLPAPGHGQEILRLLRLTHEVKLNPGDGGYLVCLPR